MNVKAKSTNTKVSVIGLTEILQSKSFVHIAFILTLLLIGFESLFILPSNFLFLP